MLQPAAHPSLHGLPSARSLTYVQGCTIVLVLVILNSLLAALGSLLWVHLPYWPAYVVFALACSFFRWWGVAIAVLTPIASCALGIGGGAPTLYIFVNLLQAVLILGAVRILRLNPGLPSWLDKVKYLLFIVFMPSVIGASAAWILRQWVDSDADDPVYFSYVGWWTAENFLPAMVPGIWLHSVVGEMYRPFAWGIRDRARSWLRRTFEYATPWMVSLLIVGAMILSLVLHEIRSVKVTPAIWKRVHEISSENVPFRWLVLALAVSILYSLGSSVRYARRSWLLEEAVRRHLPTREEAARVLCGVAATTERRMVTVAFTDIRNFTEKSSRFPPSELLEWLNAYFDRMCAVCSRNGGCVDKFIGDGMMIVFGMAENTSGAREAVLCALDMLDELPLLNKAFSESGYPEVAIGIGIHSGPVIVGEIGSHDRRQYTVIGDVVNVASRMEGKTKELCSDFLPILVSNDVLREAGLLLDSRVSTGFAAVPAELRGVQSPPALFGIKDAPTAREMIRLAAKRPPHSSGKVWNSL
jgi:class 3 adenylate cyclase